MHEARAPHLTAAQTAPTPPRQEHNERSLWIGDSWAGLTAMLVAIPSSIAYGLAIFSALGPGYFSQGVMSGVVGAIVIGLIASILGGTPKLISAPCAPAAAVLAALISS